MPPCINKYYILDLTESNSLVSFALENKNQVFLISWKNINDSECTFTWDDYVETGVIKAIDKVREISNVKKINTLGFCIGGTLFNLCCWSDCKTKKDIINSITLMASLLEFSRPRNIKNLYRRSIDIHARKLNREERCYGRIRACINLFILRPDDLIWNYYVSNYLKGEKPVPFDLLYWNGRRCKPPGPFYCWYLKTLFEDRLKKPNNLSICGQKLI